VSSPLDPVQFPRVDAMDGLRRVERHTPKRDDESRRKREQPENDAEPDEDDDGGLHIDVLA
jgi:hypothetical protein